MGYSAPFVQCRGGAPSPPVPLEKIAAARAGPALLAAGEHRDALEDVVAGKEEAAEELAQPLLQAGRRGVEYLTLFAFSSENWRRPEDEVSGLMGLVIVSVTKYLTKLAGDDELVAQQKPAFIEFLKSLRFETAEAQPALPPSHSAASFCMVVSPNQTLVMRRSLFHMQRAPQAPRGSTTFFTRTRHEH